MSCHEREAMLNDYVDDALDAAGRQRIAQHLRDCEPCRDAVAELRELVAAASRLPREIAPPRDLLPAIRSRTAPAAQHPSWPIWIGLAASLAVVSLAALATFRVIEREARPAGPADALPAALDAREPGELEREYLEATRLLLESIEQRRDRYAPETLAVLERNLTIIDQAIEELRQALADDPAGADRDGSLAAMYEQRMDLLRKFSRLSS